MRVARHHHPSAEGRVTSIRSVVDRAWAIGLPLLALLAGIAGCGSKDAAPAAGLVCVGEECADTGGAPDDGAGATDADPDADDDAGEPEDAAADGDDAAGNGSDVGSDGATGDGTGADTTVDADADLARLCAPCADDSECGDGGVCLPFATGLFCAVECDSGSSCPDGFDCLRVNLRESRGFVADLCISESGRCTECLDIDGDGFSAGVGCGEQDCAPDDPSAYPGAPERCNERDDDCDFLVDEDFDLASSLEHCGACGEVCAFAGGEAVCRRGVCELVTCLDGWTDCDDVGDCETPADALNACGGCAGLAGAPGEICGTCDRGEWVCSGREIVVCGGDPGPEFRNLCGGCTDLRAGPGGSCGRCGRGRWVCDGTEDVMCEPGGDEGDWTTCGDSCCGPGETCAFDVCAPDTACLTDDDCIGDTWCAVDAGVCLPYGAGDREEFNDECRRTVIPARFSPQLQCTFDEAPPDDPHPAWVHVLSTPVVADFDFDGDPAIVRPSIVFTADDGVDGSSELPTGLIRIIDGRTCDLQHTLVDQWTSHSSPPAIGDLDGDGTPEIVAYQAGGGLVAFAYDRDARSWGVRWRSTVAGGAPYSITGAGWGGPGLHDLDDDGIPEVLRGGIVLSADGVVLDDSLGNLAAGAAPANMSFAADLDGDGAVEVVSGDGLWEWDVDTSAWVAEPYFVGSGATPRGYLAVADLGDFALTGLDYDAAPEVAVVTGGELRVQTLEGTVVFGPVELPGGGTGGPPTIGDFDGDGRGEVAVAGRGSYTVFDLDCVILGGAGECPSGRSDGILWTRTSQDFSSSQTGSSIFDFEGDGRAEAIYADECFVRAYDGVTGDVIFSQFRSSCTWNENPIVADVDGDFNSELVVPSNTNCGDVGVGRECEGLEVGGIDPQFVGIRCEAGEDCASGLCDSGYCRCVSEEDCCGPEGCGESGFVCASPPGGTPGTGNTCRASHPRGAAGIRVYSDGLDQWVNSRPIWNQHAYFVTNVDVDGTVPSTSAARRNWEVDGLNNFRQNIQGGLDVLATPDVTSRSATGGLYCDAGVGSLPLAVMVCNRGTEAIDVDLPVDFFRGPPEDGDLICRRGTTRILSPGDCERVGCDWVSPPVSPPGVDVWVVPDADSANSECFEENNVTVLHGLHCRF